VGEGETNHTALLSRAQGARLGAVGIRGARDRLGRVLFASLVLLVALTACSPEAERSRGSGSGADIGNRDGGVTNMHGDQRRNNPEFRTPSLGRAPADAKGVPGWWVQRAR
jgi:hypothetical protein